MPRECPYDPPARLGELRAEAPITRVRSWDGSTPWLITSHEYARAALASPALSSDPAKPGYPSVGPGDVVGPNEKRPGVLLTMDGAEHAQLRRKLIGEFTVRRIEALRPRVERAVHELLDAMAAGPKPADLAGALALPLPSLIISELLGVPCADHEFFQRHSQAVLDTQAGPARTQRALGELVTYLNDLVLAKQADPGDELRATDDPAAIRAAVEELLRLLTITQAGARRAAVQDLRVGDLLIRAGEGVIIATHAANRDAAAFEHADEYDPHRAVNRHVAFGFGPHQCLGQPLARLELQVVHTALLRRFPTMKLAVDPAELSYRDTMPMYGVNELPVTW